MSKEKKTDGDSDSGRTAPSIAQTFGLDQYQFTGGKIAVLVMAALMIVIGVIGSRAGSDRPGGTSTSNDLLSNSFAPSGSEPNSQSQGEDTTGRETDTNLGLGEFSPMFLKGGFGLFVGFAIGFALRAFVRLAVVIIGFYLLTLSLMGYAGWVEIHWDVMEGQFNQLVGSLGEQFKSFKTFLTGSIPASGMTAVGLFTGLRKK